MDAIIKIAFRSFGVGRGQGAETYFKVFLYALKQTYEDNIRLYLIVPDVKNSVPHDLIELGDEIIKIPIFSRWTIPWVIDNTIKLFFSDTVFEASLLKRHKIDVIFGSKIPYKYSVLPTITWIPDFQHVHLPDMFSKEELLNRNKNYFRTAKLSTRVALMSDAVKKDFENFVPLYVYKARVLKPACYIPPSLYEADPKSVLRHYHLPDKFIYLPGQFWKHKNHELVFQALKILKDKDIRVIIVCTGYPGDGRYPTYFSDLLQKISQWGIRDQVIFLGVIPYEHVLQLMRQSVCVLNPSLFEGFGLTVDEARSVGKKLLLSDIPAHREQNPPATVFFDPLDCNDFSVKLETIWHAAIPGPDETLEIEARRSLPSRIKTSAESFMALIQEVVKK